MGQQSQESSGQFLVLSHFVLTATNAGTNLVVLFDAFAELSEREKERKATLLHFTVEFTAVRENTGLGLGSNIDCKPSKETLG